MSLALLFHYLMLNMFLMLIHPCSGACDLFVELFHGLYCSGSMCVGVTLWFGCGGVLSVCRLRHCLSEWLVWQRARHYVFRVRSCVCPGKIVIWIANLQG